MQSFFIFCSGADTTILDQSSEGERTKYAGIGATVFFTALMAFFAASYALYTVFDSYWIAGAFGFVWGLLIFNLDRYIVSTLKKSDKKINEIWQATPRIILAIIIAVVISKPLELKIFEKEIDRVLLEEKNQMTLENQEQVAQLYAVEESAFAKAIQDLKTEITTKEVEVNALYNNYITEAEGTSGTNKLGKGPVYKEKREKHDAALSELTALKEKNTEKIASIESQIAALQQNEATQLAESQPIIDNFDGLMARIEALNKLPFLTSFFIFLLFLAVETSPIIAKVLAPRGEYDLKLAEREELVKSWVTQQKQQQDVLVQTDKELNNRVYADIAEEDALYAYKKKMARELMQQQADAFYKKQKGILG
ncbi:hypothetical protein BST92_03885 [Nonlabens arenilitoris]|uniref:DUF4407 domain-containing protein n=1 Tax=Nonlabens arenilitoris TaxID=1217969 RepID=A0A2S7U935_9FLAO|nr:DUF4407 domain-containing protein [Nonlabens arenilitoris]PQJ31117.1 hypothetical protein BST92_03885 [Nonlabens arenilitoris]